MNVVNNSQKEERTWAMCCHLAALAGYFTGIGQIIGPLIVWLIKKDQYPFVDDQGKESLNFQISMTIYMIASGLLSIILIGIPLLIGLMIFDLVEIIIGAVAANDGRAHRYPMSIRFIK